MNDFPDYKAAELQMPLFSRDGHTYQLSQRELKDYTRRVVDVALHAIAYAWDEYVNAPPLKRGTKQQELYSLLDALIEE